MAQQHPCQHDGKAQLMAASSAAWGANKQNLDAAQLSKATASYSPKILAQPPAPRQFLDGDEGKFSKPGKAGQKAAPGELSFIWGAVATEVTPAVRTAAVPLLGLAVAKFSGALDWAAQGFGSAWNWASTQTSKIFDPAQNIRKPGEWRAPSTGPKSDIRIKSAQELLGEASDPWLAEQAKPMLPSSTEFSIEDGCLVVRQEIGFGLSKGMPKASLPFPGEPTTLDYKDVLPSPVVEPDFMKFNTTLGNTTYEVTVGMSLGMSINDPMISKPTDVITHDLTLRACKVPDG